MMNNSDVVQFSRKLEELRNTYLKALPGKVRIAQKAWMKVDRQNWDEEVYKQVYRLLHNIAGGAGTYGLTSISSQARVILNEMRPSLESLQPLTKDTYTKINDLVESLEEKTNQEVSKSERKTNYLRKPTGWNARVKASEGEIFLVEDDIAQAEYLSLMLKQAGHRVQVFGNIKDIKVALDDSEPIAILMDMVFPEGELAGAKAIASIQESNTIPIIFISTRTDLEARLSAVRAGAWHYFTKPVKLNTLVEILDTYIKPRMEKKKQVLLVDDDPAISAFFASHLQQEENLEAYILNEPSRVLEVLEDMNPDLILMDYWMPECNGLELGAVIRQHQSYSDVPIIFLTEETNVDIQLTALNIGSDDFLSKTMGPERLILAIQSRLERIERIRKASAQGGWLVN